MNSFVDPYRVLGVRPEATLHEIKAAHRRLAKRYHPDGGQADTAHFLAVQEAYQTLSDPLKRREWDDRHRPGPVRADAAGMGTRATPPRRGAAAGSTAGSGPARGTAPGRGPAGSTSGGTSGGSTAGGPHDPSTRARTRRRPRPDPWSTSGRDPHSDSYTWSARNVPWWEEGVSAPGRRPPGRRRPSAGANATAGSGPATSGPWPPRDGWGAEPGPDEEPRAGRVRRRTKGTGPAATSGRGAAAAGGATAGTSRPSGAGAHRSEQGSGAPASGSDFDVYSRSSGAAWSMASRLYFRRADADLPRGAAEPFGHRWTSADGGGGGSGAQRRSPGPAPRATAGAGGAAAAPSGAAAGSAASGAAPGGTTAGAAPGYSTAGGAYAARAGVTRAGAVFDSVRHRIDEAAGWPNVRDRVLYATLAWLAPLIFIAGATPGNLGLVRALVLGGLLALFALLPRVAYLAAVGGSAALVAGAGLLMGQALLGPVEGGTLDWLAPLVLGVVYLAAALLAARDWPLPRPWAAT